MESGVPRQAPTPPRPSPRPRGWAGNTLVWQSVVALVAVAAFARTLGFGWVYDDQMEIVRNTLVHSLEHLPTLFTTTVWAGSGMETYLYRPLALLTYALNYQFSGPDPAGFHLANILLHAGVSVLVVRLGLLWGLAPAAAGLGGLLFAIHPVHVEVAAAVFGRKDLLASGFVLAMVLGHRGALRRGRWRLAVPVAAFGAALLSKEIGVVGIFLVAAHDLFLERDRRRFLESGRAAGLYIAYLSTLLLYVLIRNQVTGTLGVPETSFYDNPLVEADLFARLATVVVVAGRGLTVLALPLTLSPDYSYNAIPLVDSPLDPRFLAALAFLAGGGLLLARIRPGYPGIHSRPGWRTVVLLALAWYALALLPVSNLLVTTGTIFGERLLYLPSVAFCLLVGLALHRMARWRPRFAVALTAVLLGGMTLQNQRYLSAWTNDIALFRWAVANVPNSTKAHHKLGEELLRVGEPGEALRSLDRALAIAPGNEFAAATRAVAVAELAGRYLPPPLGRGEEGGYPPDPEVLHALGQFLRERGELERAVGYWEEALQVDPDHPESLADLALIRVMEADTATALDYLVRAIRGRPTLASAWYNLGQLYLARGEVPQAQQALARFLETADPRLTPQIQWARQTLQALNAG